MTMRVLTKLGVITVAVLFIGCSNSYTIRKYDTLNIRGNAIIETKAGPRILVSETLITQDSLKALEFPSGLIIRLHANDINRIVQNTDKKLQYGIMGALGVATWVLLTADIWNDDDNSGYTFFWSAILAAPAGGTGYLIGSLSQKEYTYHFESNELVGPEHSLP